MWISDFSIRLKRRSFHFHFTYSVKMTIKKSWLSVLLAICLWCSATSVYGADSNTIGNATTTSTPAPFITSTTSKSSSPSTVAPVTRNANITSTTVAPTSTPLDTCPQRNASCGDCVKDIKCFWCGADNSCRKYLVSLKKIIPQDCEGNDWYWKQCFAAGQILIYVIPSVSFVVLVILGCCVYCLCCRNRSQRSYGKEDKKMQRRREEIKQRHAERRAERKMRTDAIRQKYGLLSNEDDAEVA